jgi:hypothetical protein
MATYFGQLRDLLHARGGRLKRCPMDGDTRAIGNKGTTYAAKEKILCFLRLLA